MLCRGDFTSSPPKKCFFDVKRTDEIHENSVVGVAHKNLSLEPAPVVYTLRFRVFNGHQRRRKEQATTVLLEAEPARQGFFIVNEKRAARGTALSIPTVPQ